MSSLLKPTLYWWLAAVFYLYEMVLRASSGVLAQDLRLSFGLDAQQLGLLSAAYYWAYTPLQIPCGLILDKLGPRRLISGSCLLCALAALIFGTTSNLYIAIFSRFLMGAGSACAFIGTLMLIAGWFDLRHFSFMAGLTNLMGALGGTFAGQPLVFLMDKMGWRNALIFLGLAGVGLSALIFFVLRDPPVAQKSPVAIIPLLKSVLYKKQVWLAGLIGGLLYLPISAFAELWAVPFIQSVYNVTTHQASFVPMAIYIGMGVGSPFIAVLSKKWSYRHVLVAVSILSTLLFALIAFAPLFSFMCTVVLAALAGFVLGGQILAFSISQQAVEPYQAGTASSFTNTLIMTFGLVFQPLLGSVLHFTWKFMHGQTENGMPFYTASMYQYAILVLPVCFAMSFFLSCKLKTKNKKACEKEERCLG